MPGHLEGLQQKLAVVANRDPQRTETTLTHLLVNLIVDANLALGVDDLEEITFEAPLGDGSRRRIDVEAANCIIEVKRDLSKSGALIDAGDQLAGYVTSRMANTRQRHVGVLTDGREWHLRYPGRDGRLHDVDTLVVDPAHPDAETWSLWLEGVFATVQDIEPTPSEVHRRLGTGSSGFQLDVTTLRSLWDAASHQAECRLKRTLWAKSLATALGTDLGNSESLFINHTYLVMVADLIAHAAAGFPITGSGSPQPISSPGSSFAKTPFVG